MEYKKNTFNLEARTAKFGEAVIDFVKPLKKDIILAPMISQLVRSATSVGANYCEADGASSKRDFRNKIYICKKEAKETKHWLRMIVRVKPELREQIASLWKEAQESTLIFSASINTVSGKRGKQI
jgi:four helix bundle protein